ncbi:flagellar biosynthesis anti-sigma factor FlgM [Desulfoscipio gibsoniae]|uniref:Negative regulator of flagellin synthesis n=1 Tax=Desulfoscipio gibsoniae DSM 7213 TaxID=767817 RepID=R4KGH7_9FIRM|nr:flagellar biosynthesis anti-sigma factor FlgM [Desulfoscipio gibsoniae]AGL01704.1 flagellar biosynthesis anti-sigma factor FlgM [Desulfoscipio gibsoniae DSM 7213]
MKITHLGSGMIDAYKAQNDKNKNIKQNNSAPDRDRVEISSVGKELQTYRAKLKEMPDVRQERVDALKTQIKNGNYEPSAEKIAEGILRERRLDTKV